MSRFTVTENIRRFRELLAQPLDASRRRTIQALLAEEEAKLADEPRDDPASAARGRATP